MAQCNFSIQFHVSADEVASRARNAIGNAGGTFQGDANSGIFDVSTPVGAIRGNYVIENPVIHVTITSKPFFVSCNMIEKQLRSYFAAVA